MSRRAASLVALTGFFTFFTLSAGPLVAQAPRKAIKSVSDLPAFTYSITGSQDDLIRSADGRFRLINPKGSVELLQARMR